MWGDLRLSTKYNVFGNYERYVFMGEFWIMGGYGGKLGLPPMGSSGLWGVMGGDEVSPQMGGYGGRCSATSPKAMSVRSPMPWLGMGCASIGREDQVSHDDTMGCMGVTVMEVFFGWWDSGL